MCEVVSAIVSIVSAVVGGYSSHENAQQQGYNLEAEQTVQNQQRKLEADNINSQFTQEQMERARLEAMERGRIRASAGEAGLGGTGIYTMDLRAAAASRRDIASLEASKRKGLEGNALGSAADLARYRAQKNALPSRSVIVTNSISRIGNSASSNPNGFKQLFG